MNDGTTCHFVTDGIPSALTRAGGAGGDGDVLVLGGASTVNHSLAGGLIDEVRLHVVPFTLGPARGCSKGSRR